MLIEIIKVFANVERYEPYKSEDTTNELDDIGNRLACDLPERVLEYAHSLPEDI